MKENEVLHEFNETWSKLLENLSAFGEDGFNRKPAPEKWSAGQVAQHLIKANSGFPKMVSGESEETDREPGAMIERIRSDFADFGIKMEAAAFLVPEDRIYEKENSIESLENIKSEIDKILENIDLSRTSKSFEFPVYGHLTGLETLAFIVYHTQRHIHQLEKLQEK